MVDFGIAAAGSKSRIQNMVNVNGQDIQKAFASGCCNGVAGMVNICPGVSTLRQRTIGKWIQNAFIWVFFTSKKHQTNIEIDLFNVAIYATRRLAWGVTYCSSVCGQP